MTVARFSAQPADTGLYRREHEHDACGVALVATQGRITSGTSASADVVRSRNGGSSQS